MSEETQHNIDRRRLLRRAGTVAAGVVGAGAVGAAVSSPAQAAPGDELLQGPNTGVSPTEFAGSSGDPLLSLTNPAGPALRLTPGAAPTGANPVGSFRMHVPDPEGPPVAEIFVVQESGVVDFVHTSWNTNQLVPIIPFRLVDTRNVAGRQFIINAAGNLDPQNRLKPGATIHIALDDIIIDGVAMHGSVTSVGAVSNGYLSMFPTGVPRPAVSTLNYPASSIISSLGNAFVVGHGFHAVADTGAISIYNFGGPTHVLLDVSAFTLVLGVGGFPEEKATAAKALKPARGQQGAIPKQQQRRAR